MSDTPASWEADRSQWEAQQIHTFTSWVNTLLRQKDVEISDVTKDFADGVLLCKLLEVLSGEPVRVTEPRFLMHKYENLNNAFRRMDRMGIRNPSVSPDNVLEGDVKFILGMVWVFILETQLANIVFADKTARDGLLLWCQRNLERYAPDVDVSDFSAAWSDGLAFTALVDRFQPGAVAWRDRLDEYRAETPDSAERTEHSVARMEEAFAQVHTHFGVEPMLDPAMVATAPEEKVIITYLSSLFHALATREDEKVAAERLGDLIKKQKQFSELKETYEAAARRILAKYAQIRDTLADFSPLASVEAARARLLAHQKFLYGGAEDAEPLSSVPDIENEYNRASSALKRLQFSLRIAGRAEYKPPEEVSPTLLASAVREISDNSRKMEEHLQHEIERLTEAEQIRSRLERILSGCERWYNECVLRILDGSEPNSASVASASCTLCAGLVKQQGEWQTRMTELQPMADKLKREIPGEPVSEQFNSLHELVDSIGPTLRERLAHLQALIQTLRDGEKALSQLKELIYRSLTDIRVLTSEAAEMCNSLCEVSFADLETEYQRDVNRLKEIKTEARKFAPEIERTVQRIPAVMLPENEGEYSPAAVNAAQRKLLEICQATLTNLVATKGRIIQDERLRKEVEDARTAFYRLLKTARQSAVSALALEPAEALEALAAQLRQFKKEYRPPLRTLRKLCRAAQGFDKVHPECKHSAKQLVQWFETNIAATTSRVQLIERFREDEARRAREKEQEARRGKLAHEMHTLLERVDLLESKIPETDIETLSQTLAALQTAKELAPEAARLHASSEALAAKIAEEAVLLDDYSFLKPADLVARIAEIVTTIDTVAAQLSELREQHQRRKERTEEIREKLKVIANSLKKVSTQVHFARQVAGAPTEQLEQWEACLALYKGEQIDEQLEEALNASSNLGDTSIISQTRNFASQCSQIRQICVDARDTLLAQHSGASDVLDELEPLFAQFDKDGSGLIDVPVSQALLTGMGVAAAAEELEAFANEDKLLDLAAVVRFIRERRHVHGTREEIQGAFEQLARDHPGLVALEALEALGLSAPDLEWLCAHLEPAGATDADGRDLYAFEGLLRRAFA
eukprot:gnl/Chilomastix_cuspidata/1785.p1 GENE.gnl/Chilomastix_cuspidata/1785~~gnl/Chilomastix_cuspidata/1785.p1  ORF type:complete len:1096 (-),score=533.69 gnl/Chilomastix_cuspidata/1785:209-3496(-)